MMKENEQLAKSLNEELSLALPSKIALDEIRKALSAHINSMINENFQQLISILYRVDVSEEKLKSMLTGQPGQDAAILIADLIIERQLEKIKSRQEIPKREDEIDENEKW